MLFNSAPFLIFFPLITGFYFIFPHRHRWALLLIASCIFYMWATPQYLLILFLLIGIDYWAGIWIEDSKGIGSKKYLIMSIISTCFILFFFKYFNFFNTSFSSVANFFGFHYPEKVLRVILPIGLSFHTFQSLSYVIEVYRGRQKAERHLGIYALYVMFYPQLVAGPIERPYHLLPQFRERHYFEYQKVVDGLRRMAWGLFKKVVIADRLAILVHQIYGDVTHYQGPAFVVATIFLAFQVYCDFSGYSDIAIGAAKVMGFRLMENFSYPYFSRSFGEFWRRWHISLSTWFRDYVYAPLCGRYCPKGRKAVNLFVTFLLIGLWHGANWTFVVWGALNGFYLIVGIWTKDLRKNIRSFIGLDRHPKVLKLWQTSVTFLLFCFAGIFFGAKDMHDAWYIVKQLPQGWGCVLRKLSEVGITKSIYLLSGFDGKWVNFVIGLLLFLLLSDLWQQRSDPRPMFWDKPVLIRWGYYYCLIMGMIFFGQYGQNPFIYFQF